MLAHEVSIASTLFGSETSGLECGEILEHASPACPPVRAEFVQTSVCVGFGPGAQSARGFSTSLGEYCIFYMFQRITRQVDNKRTLLPFLSPKRSAVEI